MERSPSAKRLPALAVAERVSSDEAEPLVQEEDDRKWKARNLDDVLWGPGYEFESWRPAIACLSYCASSVAMILTNKLALSGFGAFSCPTSILFFQNLLAVAVALVLRLWQSGENDVPMLSLPIVRLWFPVNIIFVGMIWTGSYSLKHLSVAIVTVLKNTTNILVVLGDSIFFHKHQSSGVWASVVLIILSAAAGAATDLNFYAAGYAWQFFNCILTASYSLRLRWVMVAVEPLVPAGRMDEVSMMLYNNGLSLPLLGLLAIANGEFPGVFYREEFWTAPFLLAMLISGVCGIAISFCSLWCLHLTSPTTFSMVGSLNKLPTAVIGVFLFHTKMSVPSAISIAFGLAAGILFTMTKARDARLPLAPASDERELKKFTPV